MDSVSGIGVLDKAVAVLDALETGPRSLLELVDATGLPRATAHRLAAALEVHGFVGRTADGRFQLGARLSEPSLPGIARPALDPERCGTEELHPPIPASPRRPISHLRVVPPLPCMPPHPAHP